jgi:putative transcriptional regulator
MTLLAMDRRPKFPTMSEDDPIATETALTGQLLVAMPQMSDPRFARAVVYLCAHSAEGAMGLVVNRLIDSLSFSSLLEQLGVELGAEGADMPVHFGGPVEASRGFVLHTTDYVQDSTLVNDQEIGLTATVDMLKVIAAGGGPRQSVLALGYAGWAPGQLDAEIQANGWLLVPADLELLFGLDNGAKWQRSLDKLGIDLSLLSSEAGHA